MTAVCVAVAWSRALGFDPTTRRPRHDERKYDEILSSLRKRTLRIHPYYFSYVYARNDGDFRVERDTLLSEYNRHNDCSASTDYTRRK